MYLIGLALLWRPMKASPGQVAPPALRSMPAAFRSLPVTVACASGLLALLAGAVVLLCAAAHYGKLAHAACLTAGILGRMLLQALSPTLELEAPKAKCRKEEQQAPGASKGTGKTASPAAKRKAGRSRSVPAAAPAAERQPEESNARVARMLTKKAQRKARKALEQETEAKAAAAAAAQGGVDKMEDEAQRQARKALEQEAATSVAECAVDEREEEVQGLAPLAPVGAWADFEEDAVSLPPPRLSPLEREIRQVEDKVTLQGCDSEWKPAGGTLGHVYLGADGQVLQPCEFAWQSPCFLVDAEGATMHVDSPAIFLVDRTGALPLNVGPTSTGALVLSPPPEPKLMPQRVVYRRDLAMREETCWAWVKHGFCPRGKSCKWWHPELYKYE